MRVTVVFVRYGARMGRVSLPVGRGILSAPLPEVYLPILYLTPSQGET